MGLYDTISFNNDPQFKPIAREVKAWQTKTLGRPSLEHYLVTDDGQLMKEHNEWRERTDNELDELARDKTNGDYTSWDSWQTDDTTEYPIDSWKKTVDRTHHENFYHTGTIEVHKSYKGVYHSYDVRFEDGSFVRVEFNEAKELNTNQSNTILDDE